MQLMDKRCKRTEKRQIRVGAGVKLRVLSVQSPPFLEHLPDYSDEQGALERQD